MRRRRARSNPRPSLAGRVVVITGGARGIGKATATALAHRGCKIAIGDLDLAEAEHTVSELGTDSLALSLDVTDRDSFENFLAQVEERLGPIDVIVNNAGIMLLGAFEEETDDAMRRMIEINLVGVLLGTKLVLPGMKKRGRGHILNIASQAGKYGAPGGATYSATKHAVIGLTEAVRGEAAGSGVDFSWVAPFVVDTQLGAGAKQMRGMGLIAPETVAEAIVEAIETGRVEVWVPRRTRAIMVGSSLMPRRMSDFIAHLMGADSVLARADQGVRGKYQDSAGKDSELSR